MNRRYQRLSLSRVSPFLNQSKSNQQLNTTQIKSNKSNVGFGGEGKTGVPGEKPLGAE